MSEIDGLGQPTSDDLWGLMLLYNKCKQSQKLILGRSFVPYSFVRRDTTSATSLNIYLIMFRTLDSFLVLNLTRMAGCNKSFLDDVGALDAVGTQV